MRPGREISVNGFGDKLAIHRGGDDAAGIAGPFAAGEQAFNCNMHAACRVAGNPHRARRPALGPEHDGLRLDIPAHLAVEFQDARPEALRDPPGQKVMQRRAVNAGDIARAGEVARCGAAEKIDYALGRRTLRAVACVEHALLHLPLEGHTKQRIDHRVAPREMPGKILQFDSGDDT